MVKMAASNGKRISAWHQKKAAANKMAAASSKSGGAKWRNGVAWRHHAQQQAS